MDNKKDWEELEKWAENEKLNNIEKYKVDIGNIDMQQKTKGVNVVVKFLNGIFKTTKVAFIVVGIIIALSVFTVVKVNVSRFKSSVDVDINSIANMHNIKVKVISQETEDNGNGTYIFALKKKPEIQFKAIKEYGKLTEDFEANYQKYVFNNWNSSVKEKFEVEEKRTEEGILHYSNYVIADNTEEVEEAVEYIIEFLEYAEKWNKENKVVKIWQQKKNEFIVPIRNVYIKIQDNVIYPYHALFQTADEIRNDAKEQLTEISKLSRIS